MTRPLVIAHRGASGYEYENSLAAFRAAAPRGADGVELDIHSTLDGELLVHHDEKTKDGRHISRTATAALADARLPNGEPIPTLTQVLTTLGPRLLVFVELKTLAPQFDQRLLQVLDGGPNPSGYAIHSFDHAIIKRFARLRPALRRGVLNDSRAARPLVAMKEAAAADLWQDQSLIGPHLGPDVHDAGGRLIAWTVNTTERMQELMALGVDGLCTNFPDIARRTVDARAA